MFGSLLGGIVRVINAPVKIVERVGDVVTGGDGSDESKRMVSHVLPSDLGEITAQELEKLDE